jgi:hypothetical protein
MRMRYIPITPHATAAGFHVEVNGTKKSLAEN